MSPTRFALGLSLLATLSLTSGCIVVPHDHPRDSGGYTPAPATPTYPTYTVLAGGAALIPPGGAGFTITANAAGDYRLAWSDTIGDSTYFRTTAWTDGELVAAQPFGNTYVSDQRLDTVTAESVPYDGVDGVDLSPSLQPLYVDAEMNGGAAPIYFVDGVTGLDSQAYGPAAFYIQ